MTKTAEETTALAVFGAIPFSEAALAVPGKPSGKYLPRIQHLSTGSCKLVSEGKAKVGSYALVDGSNVTDLGKEINVIPLCKLNKGVNTTEGGSFFAPSEEYNRCVEAVEASGFDSGCMYGPFYLLFLVDTEQFVELFLTNVSGRNEETNIDSFLPVNADAAAKHGIEARAPRAATLSSKEVTSKRGKKSYTYNVPVTNECTTRLNVQNPPTQEDVISQCNKFVAQADVETETESRSR